MHNMDNAYNRDIAIVGISVYSPAGDSAEKFWHGIAGGGDFIVDAPDRVIEQYHFTGEPNGMDRFYCSRGGFLESMSIDPIRYGIMPIAAKGTDPEQFFSLLGAEHALIDAGVFEKKTPLQKCSFILGRGGFSGLVQLRVIDIMRTSRQFAVLLQKALPSLTDADVEKVKEAYQSHMGRYQPDMALGAMPNIIAAIVANRFDIQGPSYIIDAACSSGIVAINNSIALLRSGQCDISLAGAMFASQSAMFWSIFELLGALSHKQVIAPFSEEADGLLIGQGYGFIVMKTLRRALEDGDRIYAVIKETAICSDGASAHMMATSVDGQTRLLRQAWGQSGLEPDKIGYVEAHGTGTVVGDRNELTALKNFFGDSGRPRAYVGSVKSNIGHLMPAAGMIGVIKTALSLYWRKIPPTLHCERPQPVMYESRFMPPQELIDWDGEQFPLVAGVNAFGFGGVNAHAILAAYEPPVGAKRTQRRRYLGEALMVSAANGGALIEKIKNGDNTDTGGDWRIVVFEPDALRIKQAIAIIEKGEPCRGNAEIWFTNRPLLANGGKIVYMLPGFNEEWKTETDTVSEAFGLPYMGELLEHAEDKKEAHRIAQLVSFVKWLSINALEKLGAAADMYAGYGIGEWDAAEYAGLFDCGIGEWAEELYKKRISYSASQFGIGLYMPEASGLPAMRYQFIEALDFNKGSVPVWSATSLETIPTDKEGYLSNFSRDLTKPVLFRQLIKKLYNEQNGRLFIQIGLGPLTGFVADTLAGKDFCTIPANVADRDGADQLRRIAALLFIEGRGTDAAFLGVSPQYRVNRSVMRLSPGPDPIMPEMPEMDAIIKGRYGSGGAANMLAGNDMYAADMFLAAGAASPLQGGVVAEAVGENMREAVAAQRELARFFGLQAQARPVGDPQPIGAAQPFGAQLNQAQPSRAQPSLTQPSRTQPTQAQPMPKTGFKFEETLHMTLDDHMYLLDHAIVRQKDGWPYRGDLNPVVPFAMTIELIAEIAKNRAPGKKLVKLCNGAAYKWVAMEKPIDVAIKGEWIGEDTVRIGFDEYATFDCVLAEGWPEPPPEYAGAIDVGKKIIEKAIPVDLYELFSFHGPKYQTLITQDSICDRGMTCHLSKREGKGSLLDIMGQQLGLFIHLTQKVNTISFPVRLKELTFYSDIFDQEGVFENTMIIKRFSDSVAIADFVIKRGGKIWCIARDYVAQRFVNVKAVWDIVRNPRESRLAEEIAPGVYFCENDSPENLVALLAKRYLCEPDRDVYDRIETPKRRREFIVSRIALKDAVRTLMAYPDGTMPYPVEFFCTHDSDGRPVLGGYGEFAKKVENLCISIAHKGAAAAATVSDAPVGIDLEKIEVKTDEFINAAYTEHEAGLIKGSGKPEAAVQLWVAKEAYAKKLGTGLKGNPKRYKVSAVDGDVVTVEGCRVKTAKVGTGYLAGWTL